MAEFLVIRIAANRDQSCEWIVVDNNGTRKSPPRSGALEEAANEAGGRDVVVLVPAAAVLTSTVDIPIKGGARLRAALPFALEESIAAEIDTMHIASGERRDSGRLAVACVAREQMDAWVERLRAAGIDAARLVPENYGLARIPGTLSMLVAGNQVMFNDGADNEFVMQDVQPVDLLAVAGLLENQPAAAGTGGTAATSARHLLVYCDPEAEQRFQHDWTVLRHELASVDINLLPDGILPRLAVTVAAGNGVNLLQGRYGRKAELGAMFRPWKYAAMLLASFCLAAFAGKIIDVYRLGADEAALRAQFTEEYRQIRPGDSSEILDPAATVSSLRRSLGTPTTSAVFLPTLQQLGLALQQNQSVAVEAISYRAGIIDVRLTAPDVATLDNIQKLVSSSGRFSASIQTTDNVGDKISSRIQIREAGA